MKLPVNENKELSIWEALISVFVLLLFLSYNIFFENGEIFGSYSNQYIILISALTAVIIGLFNKVTYTKIFIKIKENLKNVFVPVLILFLVGALTGTWLISGVIPAMVYYGLQIVNPTIFLPVSVIIAAIVSIATGSSWTTSATVGISLVGVGTVLGISAGVIAGAVISGAYFGDKMSPLSDTTNLASAVAGIDIFTHIKYMSLTTVPTFIVSLIFFTIISFNTNTSGNADLNVLLDTINKTFQITPLLFLVPGIVIILILLRANPLFALFTGIILAIVFSIIFQSELLEKLSHSNFKILVKSVFSDIEIQTNNNILDKLFSSGGMKGMIWTVLLIICAMIFGGVMDSIGALARITKALLKISHSIFGLFASTVVSCIGLNIISSDQYLAIVIPGKMLKKAYNDKKLEPENLSRTLEDSGTVTSVLIPWNTCGAYQSNVLGVSVADYFVYALFNYLSPITTLILAAFRIKIKQQSEKIINS